MQNEHIRKLLMAAVGIYLMYTGITLIGDVFTSEPKYAWFFIAAGGVFTVIGLITAVLHLRSYIYYMKEMMTANAERVFADETEEKEISANAWDSIAVSIPEASEMEETEMQPEKVRKKPLFKKAEVQSGKGTVVEASEVKRILEESAALKTEAAQKESETSERKRSLEHTGISKTKVLSEDAEELEAEVLLEDAEELETEVLLEDAEELETEVLLEDAEELEEEILPEDAEVFDADAFEQTGQIDLDAADALDLEE